MCPNCLIVVYNFKSEILIPVRICFVAISLDIRETFLGERTGILKECVCVCGCVCMCVCVCVCVCERERESEKFIQAEVMTSIKLDFVPHTKFNSIFKFSHRLLKISKRISSKLKIVCHFKHPWYSSSLHYLLLNSKAK